MSSLLRRGIDCTAHGFDIRPLIAQPGHDLHRPATDFAIQDPLAVKRHDALR